ncbi:MAG: anti-sigma factor family protein [Candidatus Binataceae bacterium]
MKTALVCREYRNEFLTAHVDGELSPLERRVADDHVAGCADCRARLADERALKALVHQHVRIIKAPAALRAGIRSVIARAAEAPSEGRRFQMPWRRDDFRGGRGFDAAHRDGGAISMRRRFGQPRAWAPIAAVLAILVLTGLFAGRNPTATANRRSVAPSVPYFDLAINKFLMYERSFEPNVPTDAFESRNGPYYAWVVPNDSVKRVSDIFNDVAQSYREVHMPDDLLNLESLGYELVGGRLDHLANGRPVTYTLYQGGSGSILCISFRDSTIAAPNGAILWLGMHSFYEYKGYSICLTFYPTGHFVSILVAHTRLPDLVRDVVYAEK